jgi:hypothetical protein
VHRDLKPANVLVAGEMREVHVYLTDFGLADPSPLERDEHVFLGTLDFIAPEQIKDDPVDARTDVYSLGCVLYQALTGDSPFADVESDAAMVFAHYSTPPPRVSEAGVPEPFDPVIARAMAKDPNDRYLSAGDLGRAALAAASGRAMPRTERNVATGAAAPKTVTAVAAAPPPEQRHGAPLSVFISYRRQDCQPQANGLCDGLRHRLEGARIFMDLDSIRPGADWRRDIERAIAACNVVLVLIGNDWLGAGTTGSLRIDDPNDIVRIEIAAALERGVAIIPILVEGTPMPAGDGLPPDIAGLTRFNAIELSDRRWRADIDRVTEAIGFLADPQGLEG